MRRLVLPLFLTILAGCGAVEDFLAQQQADLSNYYDTDPDARSCQTGALKESERQEVLTRLNEIRNLHGLPPVAYESSWNTQVDQAALIFVANGSITHYPNDQWRCYTEDGATGAAASNISIRTLGSGLSSYSFIVGWLIDNHDVAGGTGHRQWLLDPFMSKIAFGRVDGQPAVDDTMVTGAALKVIGATQSAGNMVNDFVAYPYGEYPSDLVDTGYWLSFSPIADKNSYGGANVSTDMSVATVTMTDEHGSTVAVSATAYENTGGAPLAVVQWKAAITAGVTYTVTVTGAKVNGTYKSYTYTFKLV